MRLWVSSCYILRILRRFFRGAGNLISCDESHSDPTQGRYSRVSVLDDLLLRIRSKQGVNDQGWNHSKFIYRETKFAY